LRQKTGGHTFKKRKTSKVKAIDNKSKKKKNFRTNSYRGKWGV